MTFIRTLSAALLTLSCLTYPAQAQQSSDAVAPEASTDEPAVAAVVMPPEVNLSGEDLPRVRSANWMAVTANPLASEAGAAVLRNGGNAIDAMVAIQLTLGLVEPQSSGLGGGAFLVYWDAEQKRLTTFDGRETAPMAALPTLFQDDEGQPLKFFDAVVGGRSVGVPGTPMLLQAVHGRYGSQPWATLFDGAIGMAEDGFTVSPRMANSIARDADRLSRYETTRSYFFKAD
ncbi:MAG: gamma-glutamyltransferase, partial [Rhizobiales bacterium]|nr:gamma-glutamyltransferase [Hyphomicrobiales bacterium]